MRKDFQQPPDFTMLYCLCVNPFTNQLLFAAHMMDEALYGLGQICHRAGCALAGAAFHHNVTQTFDHRMNFTSMPHRGWDHVGRLNHKVPYRGGEPVFEIGVESILCLAGLKVEKPEDQRAGETEERGGERNP